MPADDQPQGSRDDMGNRLEAVLDRVVAHTLPPAQGTILVLTFPKDTPFNDPEIAAGITVLINSMKEKHGFAGAIALAHGNTIQSFDREGLAQLGLQVIPREVREDGV